MMPNPTTINLHAAATRYRRNYAKKREGEDA